MALTSAGERGEMIGDEFLHRRGLLAAYPFDQVVVAREDSVLVVDRDVAQVLREFVRANRAVL